MEDKHKHIQEAQQWLGLLRRGTDKYDLFFGCLRQELEKGGFSLADIGTSNEELEELRVNGCKISVQKWLDSLRRGTDECDSCLGYLRQEDREGWFLTRRHRYQRGRALFA